jgi:hypothetical protein
VSASRFPISGGRFLVKSALFLALALSGGSALAIRIENGSNPIELDFTEDAAVDYHFTHGNGNTTPAPPPGVFNQNYDPTSDNYFDWINRFETQFSMGPWHADLRFDSALFANTLQVSNTQTQEGAYLAKLLQNRYIDNFELEKISASYVSPHLEATLGDFYLNYGRGMVVSLRKIDALGVDTTLRGGTVTARGGGFSVGVAGGITNVVNTDPSLGGVAPDPEDPIVAGRLEYRLPQIFAVGVDGALMWQNLGTLNQEGVTGGVGATAPQIRSSPISPLGFGSVESTVFPASQDQARVFTQNYSATLELPNLWGHGSAYAEYAHQFQNDGNIQSEGNALYAGVNAYLGDFTLQAEYKDYAYFNAPTFSSLPSLAFPAFHQQDVYNNPPNLEEIWQEEDLTTRILGPRLRVDWQISEHFKPYATFLYFIDADNAYDIYAASGGLDANWQQHRSHIAFSGGYRRQVYNSNSESDGQLYKTEFWFQYDVIQAVSARYALELDGLHRTHRDYGFSSYQIWNQGYAYLSLRHSRFSASAGIEYYNQFADIQPWLPNVSGSFNINQNLLVRAFVGGREAGLRCINGVCRLYPAFNGATVELVARY